MRPTCPECDSIMVISDDDFGTYYCEPCNKAELKEERKQPTYIETLFNTLNEITKEDL